MSKKIFLFVILILVIFSLKTNIFAEENLDSSTNNPHESEIIQDLKHDTAGELPKDTQEPEPEQNPPPPVFLTTTTSGAQPYKSTESFQVEPQSGTASLNIPIDVPSGRKGIQPTISLMYNSSSPNGPLGVGWNLELGSIQRSTKRGVPKYDNSDTFILVQQGSSQELVNIGGNQYRAKIEGAFMRIEFINNSYWLVTDKKGTKYFFGENPLSQQGGQSGVFKWCLDWVDEPNGNFMEITYIKYPESPGQIYPQYINYTGNGSPYLNPFAHIEFGYENRTDTNLSYRTGFAVTTGKRLFEILIEVNNNLQRRYQLDYGAYSSATQRSLLRSITQYGSDGTPLPPTTFTYRDTIQKNFSPTGVWMDNFGAGDQYMPLSGDFNNDGLTDIMVKQNSNGNWLVALNTGSHSFASPVSWIESFGPGQNYLAFTGDFNGDGFTDIMNKNSGTWAVALNAVNTGSNRFINPREWITNFGADLIPFTGDFNGDGLTDIMVKDNNGVWRVALNTANSTFEDKGVWISGFGVGGQDQYAPSVADFNADGLTDIMVKQNSNGSWLIALNTGNNSFIETGTWISSFGRGQSYIAMAFDLNTDGFSDAVIKDSGTWSVALNTGTNSFDNPSIWIVGFGNNGSGLEHVPMAGDFDADGLTDIMIKYVSSGQWAVALHSTGLVPDLLTQIQNGIGATTQINYTPSTQYDNTGADDISDLPFPVQTVSIVTATDQVSGQSYTTNYSYRYGLFDFQDREFRGFGYVKVTDVDGNYSETEFHQDDYKKGRIREQRSLEYVDGTPEHDKLYTKVHNEWRTRDEAPSSKFVYLGRTDNYIYNGDSTYKQTAVQYGENFETCSGYDAYGNVIEVIELGDVSLTGDERNSYTEYNYNTGLRLLTFPKHTYLQDSQGNKKSEKWFYYDNHTSIDDLPTKGLLTKDEAWLYNPITSIEQRVSSIYNYDTYGNLTSTTDALNHTTTIDYDSTYHIFPKTTTNALGHQVINEYYGVDGVPLNDGNYQGLWGQTKSSQDPNGNKSYSIYDTFGRVIKTISPYDTIEYPASSIEYHLESTPIKIISHQREKSGQSGTLDSVSFYDGLGRLIQTKTESEQSNRFIVSGQTEYNSRGLPYKKYLPFFDATYSFTELVPLSLNPYNPAVISYDPMGRVVQSTNPDGTYSNIIYDDWVTTTIDENGHKQASYFDAYGRLITKQEFSGNSSANYALYSTTNYAYDTLGNLTQTQDNSNNTTTITYDTLGRKISMQDPDMGNWSYAYDVLGNLISQTDAKNQTIQFSYDALNRLTTKNYPQTTNNVSYIYDDVAIANSKGRLTKAAYSQSQDTKFFYDALGRETKSQKIIDNTTYAVERSYDAAGRLISVTYPDGEVVNYIYNSAGQIEQVRNLSSSDFSTKLLLHNNGPNNFLDSSASNHTITANGNAQIDNAQYKFGLASGLFDGTGDYLTIPDSDDWNLAGGDFTIEAWINFGESVIGGTMVAQGNFDGQPTMKGAFFFSYGSDLLYFQYTTDGKPSGAHNENTPWTPSPNTWHHVAIVRSGSNGYFFVDGRQIGSFSFEANSIYNTDLDLIVGAYQNTWTPTETYQSFFNGWIDEVRISKGIARWTENFIPPAEEYSASSGAQNYVSNVDYNASGQTTHIEYGNGVVTNYEYDNNTLRLTHLVTEHQASRIQDLTYTYDSAGNILQITDNLDISRNQTFTYDEINRLKTANGVYDYKTYAYNEIGNIISKDGLTYSYIPGDVGSGPHAVTSLSDGTIFNYDVNGNMIRTTNSESRTTTYEYDFENRLKQVFKDNKLLAQFQYDGDGGRTKKTIYPISCGGSALLNQPLQNRRYVFEFRSSFMEAAVHPEIRLSGTRESGYSDIRDKDNFVPDTLIAGSSSPGLPDNPITDNTNSNLKLIQLITQNTLPLSPGINELVLAFKEIFIIKEAEARPPPIDIGPGEGGGGGGPAITLYVGSLFEKELSGSTLLENRKHIFLGSQRICTVTNNSIKYFHTNHLGSTDTITDNNGQPIVHYEYSPYGEIALTEGGDSTDFKFTGKPLDDETGLYYYGARYYNPTIGRFITPDWIIPNPTNPQALNRYTYCYNSPLSYVDPSGNFPWLAVIIGAIIGAAAGGVSSYQDTGRVQWQSVLIGAVVGGLGGYTLATGQGITLLKISAGLGMASMVTGAMPGETWGNISRYTGYAAAGLAAIDFAYNVGVGIKDWAVGKGTYHDLQTGAELTKAEVIAKYGKDGAKVYTNGITMDKAEALLKAQSKGADVLFYNPTHGAIADLTESFLETITFTGSLDRQLGSLAIQMRVDLIGYSQGSLISSNAMVYAALKGGAVPGSSLTTVGSAVGSIRSHLSAWMAGVTNVYGNTKPFDPIKLISSEMWPPGYVNGTIGLLTGGRQHTSY